MAIFIPDVAKTALNWQLWVGSVAGATDWQWRVHLFNANFTPNNATLLSDLTAIEATFVSYTGLDLLFVLDNGIVTGDFSQYVFGPVGWTVGAGVSTDTIYGYWVDGINQGGVRRLLWLERMPVPVPMNTPGQMLSFVPQFSLRQA